MVLIIRFSNMLLHWQISFLPKSDRNQMCLITILTSGFLRITAIYYYEGRKKRLFPVWICGMISLSPREFLLVTSGSHWKSCIKEDGTKILFSYSQNALGTRPAFFSRKMDPSKLYVTLNMTSQNNSQHTMPQFYKLTNKHVHNFCKSNN